MEFDRGDPVFNLLKVTVANRNQRPPLELHVELLIAYQGILDSEKIFKTLFERLHFGSSKRNTPEGVFPAEEAAISRRPFTARLT